MASDMGSSERCVRGSGDLPARILEDCTGSYGWQVPKGELLLNCGSSCDLNLSAGFNIKRVPTQPDTMPHHGPRDRQAVHHFDVRVLQLI